jgi:hypothetical protein
LTESQHIPLKRSVLNELPVVNIVTRSALYVFFISDATNKMLLYFQYDINRVAIVFRAIYEIIFIALILIYLNKARLTFIKVFFSLFVLFFLGQVMFSSRFNVEYNYIENVLIFNKYFFVFIIYYAIHKLQYSYRLIENISLLERIFIFNSICVVVGVLFSVELFRTYIDQSYRYGYSGFIPAQNEATLFFIIGISYFYYKKYVLDLKSKGFWWVVSSALLVGTKGIYFFIILLIIYHFLSNSGVKTKLLSAIFLAVASLAFSFFLKTETAQTLLGYFIVKAEQGGITDMLLSGRLASLIDKSQIIIGNWNIFNYLFGGQDQNRFAVEMDFLDLFFFFGVVGSIIYLTLYFYTLFKLQRNNTFQFFFIFSFFVLAFFGGHFFFSTTNALYLCLFSMYLISSQRMQKASQS